MQFLLIQQNMKVKLAHDFVIYAPGIVWIIGRNSGRPVY